MCASGDDGKARFGEECKRNQRKITGRFVKPSASNGLFRAAHSHNPTGMKILKKNKIFWSNLFGKRRKHLTEKGQICIMNVYYVSYIKKFIKNNVERSISKWKERQRKLLITSHGSVG